MDMDKRIGVRLTGEQWEKLQRLAVAMGRMVTPSEAVRRLIDKEPDKVNESHSQSKLSRRKARTLGLENLTEGVKEDLNKSGK